jgi:hypothetical protein
MAIIGRLLMILFFVIIGAIIFSLLKLIFKAGKATNEFNHRVNEMKKPRYPKQDDVIELDKNQYKVE